MEKLKIEIRFDEFAVGKYTPLITVTNVQTEEDLEIVKRILLYIKDRSTQ